MSTDRLSMDPVEPTKVGLIFLTNHSDVDGAIVSEAVIHWINRRDMPGRRSNESMWRDAATPPEVQGALKHLAEVTIGSYNNDRALHAVHAGALFQANRIRELVRWTTERGYLIVDEFHGVIY